MDATFVRVDMAAAALDLSRFFVQSVGQLWLNRHFWTEVDGKVHVDNAAPRATLPLYPGRIPSTPAQLTCILKLVQHVRQLDLSKLVLRGRHSHAYPWRSRSATSARSVRYDAGDPPNLLYPDDHVEYDVGAESIVDAASRDTVSLRYREAYDAMRQCGCPSLAY